MSGRKNTTKFQSDGTVSLSEINENTHIKVIRQFIQENNLPIKTAGKGITKKWIVKQIKEAVGHCDEFTLEVARILHKSVDDLYCDCDLYVEIRLQDPNGQRRAYIGDTLTTWQTVKANAAAPADFNPLSIARLVTPANYPAVGTVFDCNYVSPGVLCNIIGFMQDANNWGNVNQWGYRCGDGTVRPRFDVKISGATQWWKVQY